MYMYIAESNVFLLYFMSMHCNCCTIALFSHLSYYFIKHTSLQFTSLQKYVRSSAVVFAAALTASNDLRELNAVAFVTYHCCWSTGFSRTASKHLTSAWHSSDPLVPHVIASLLAATASACSASNQHRVWDFNTKIRFSS